MASNAQLRLETGTLQISGVLDRAAVIALWPQLQRDKAQVQRLDLQHLQDLDSAGLALLAELQAALPHAPIGAPQALNELCSAYRLSPSLDFNAFSAGS